MNSRDESLVERFKTSVLVYDTCGTVLPFEAYTIHDVALFLRVVAFRHKIAAKR